MGPGERLADLCGTMPRPGPEGAEEGACWEGAGEAGLTGRGRLDGI